MKKLLFLLLSVLSVTLNAATYYVATNGDDSRTATQAQNIATPWATWYKFNHSAIVAGDTIYVRGGVYYAPADNDQTTYSSGIHIGDQWSGPKVGTRADPICYFAYPPDFASGNIPIWDMKNVTDGYDFSPTNFWGLTVYGSFIKLKGLTIRNIWGINASSSAIGFAVTSSDHVTVEQCVCYNTRNRGFQSAYSDTTYFINCDSYDHCDSLNPDLPGNDGYCFLSSWAGSPYDDVFFVGCRAWNGGDDGFTTGGNGLSSVDSCWSFNNGMLLGEGHGFKLGWIEPEGADAPLNQRYTHNLAVYNRSDGFTTNDGDNSEYCGSMQFYNNTAYHNGYYATRFPGAGAHGIVIYNTQDANDAHELARIFRNNLSYDNEDGELLTQTGGLYTHSNNSWDSQVTLSDADFVSLDSATAIAIMKGPRQAGGWLPSLGNFLKLASTSDLIDKGTNVSLPYEGSAPDLGAYEYELPSDVSAPQISTNSLTYTTYLAVGTGGHTIYDGGGTISAKGICWATHTAPDLTDNVKSCGTGTADFTTTISGLPAGTIIYMRAYAINETGTGYGLTEVVTTHASDFVGNGAQFYKHNGVLMKL